MKTILLVIAVILSSSSVMAACPNLTGSYKCSTRRTKEEKVKITQKKLPNGTTQYAIDAYDSIIADGIQRAIAATKEIKDIQYVATCTQDSSLKLRVRGRAVKNGLGLGKAELEALITLTATRDLKVQISGAIMEIPATDEGLCTRL
ncbi:MAG: hypothetical protein AB7O96_09525 [Pseudobdellovibrionaceae bacterium]